MVGRGAILMGLVLASSLFAWTASSNSAGAPQNSAEGGCTCHNASPDTGVTVALQGLPEAYSTGTTYDLTLTITGGPVPVPAASQNQGGFALKVTAGTLLAEDGITITGGTFATHSATTNNQRSWSLQWAAPAASTGAVTVTVSGNSVNGDGANAGGFDRWNRATYSVPAMSGGQNATDASSPAPNGSDGDSPGLPVVGVLVAVAVLAVARRRR